jgi:hypothetical protein
MSSARTNRKSEATGIKGGQTNKTKKNQLISSQRRRIIKSVANSSPAALNTHKKPTIMKQRFAKNLICKLSKKN